MIPHLQYSLTPEERAFCDRVIAAGCHEVKYHTFAVVEQCLAENIPGDFAEAGVMSGAHPAIMLYVLKKHGVRDRKVHMFDSFQGIPRATENDHRDTQWVYGLSPGNRMISTGISASSLKNTLDHICNAGVYDPELLIAHEGWFEESLEKDAREVKSLAILRSDVDLYESTRLVYTHLYPKVISNGFVVDDDYGESPETACRQALQSVIGKQVATPVDGQPTTAWWRKA